MRKSTAQNPGSGLQRGHAVAIIRGLLVALLFVFIGCKKEDPVLAIETSDWPIIRLGFHEFRAPPDFAAPDMAATIGSMSLDVLKNQPGRPEDLAAARDGVGKILQRITIGDWTVLIAEEDMGLVVSDYTYLVLGYVRVGPDVVVTTDTIDRTTFPDGNDPSKWVFHQQTSVRQDAPGIAATGFVFDGLMFETRSAGAAHPIAAEFTASAALADRSGQVVADAAVANNYEVRFITGPSDSIDDGRPLAMPDDVASIPGAQVSNSSLTVDGASAGFSRVRMGEGEDQQAWFDGTIFWPGGDRPGESLTSAHMQFINRDRPEAEAEARALGLLTSTRRIR